MLHIHIPGLAAVPVPYGDGGVYADWRAVLPPPVAGAPASVVPGRRTAASTPLSPAGGAAAAAAPAVTSAVCAGATSCAILIQVWRIRIHGGSVYCS